MKPSARLRTAPRSLFGQRREATPSTLHLARGRRVEPAQQMQQRALAGARRADDRDALAARDGEIDAEQHRHVERAAAIGLGEPAAGEHRPRAVTAAHS